MADKLTQAEVLALMNDGWECCYSHGIRSRGQWRLQFGKLGRGGESKHIDGRTMNALEKKMLIKRLPYQVGTFHTRYVLSKHLPAAPERKEG